MSRNYSPVLIDIPPTLQEIVDVDFDFFDLDPVDFHAVKRLLGQLFSADAELLNLTDFSDLIINQANVGSTVKVDGKESDPYALLTAVNTNVHKVRSQGLIAHEETKRQPLFKRLYRKTLLLKGLWNISCPSVP